LNKTTISRFIRYSSIAPETSHSSIDFVSFSPAVIRPSNVLFIAGTVAKMLSKTRQVEEEENPFLPPPVDLDKVPLVDKDRLIVDTICNFDFSNLQSWLREVFLDQSDEIGLWESNLPMYLFPQIHHFPEFALKCQAHYIPN
jgi:hypothetical protein